jgi:NADH:ubiquinone oxidoreductase subunit F (NADH-binding)
LPEDRLDTPLAYEHVMGSGSVIVLNRNRDIIDLVYRDIDFLADESCGKCTPCREGTEVMMEIYARMINHESMEEDIEVLKSLSQTMQLASICGLGQSAPTPVLDSLEYFRDEYEQRLKQSRYLRRMAQGARRKEGTRF